MKKWFILGCLLMMGTIAIIGCASTNPVRTTRSPGVERIPTTIAMHALLSNTAPTSHFGSMRLMSKNSKQNVYLAPPTKSQMYVTPLSQMLTSELMVQMAQLGFDLRELPYEIKESSDSARPDSYVISLDLLDDLRHQHGLEAVIVGNVYFMSDASRHSREKRVSAAYLKVIDTNTLEVLCQVNMPYQEYGREMNRLAESMARELAIMAGLIE
jgi:hypothetical protein